MLKSEYGETFEIDEIAALESQMIQFMIEDECADNVIPVPFTSATISKIIEYCKKHVELSKKDDNDDDKAVEDLKSFDVEFVKLDTDIIQDILLAANFLNIKKLIDLMACPHYGFSKLHQLDTFYNALNVNDQYSLNSAAGGNFLDKLPDDCLKIIESKSKVRQTRAKAVVAKVSSNSSAPAISADVAELNDMVRALLLDKKNQYSAQTSSPTPALIKAVEPNCVTCGGTHAYQNCPATCGNIYQDNIQEYVSQAAVAN
nr:SKP1-like protein 1B [Tanacetum cinerariifolium]